MSSQPGKGGTLVASNPHLCPPHAPLIPFGHASAGNILEIASSDRVQLLNDHWTYSSLESLDSGGKSFSHPDFDDSNWDSLSWGKSRVDDSAEIQATSRIYRKTFELTPTWEDLYLYLRFSGFQSDFMLWVNGHPVGQSQGGSFAEFDLKPFLSPGINTLAVKVPSSGSTPEPRMDTFQEVYVVARPELFVEDLFASTILGKKFQTGRISLELDVAKRERSPNGNFG
ncbi:MAG: sugar-binding domain-containing protein [Bacteroidota bacterium]